MLTPQQFGDLIKTFGPLSACLMLAVLGLLREWVVPKSAVDRMRADHQKEIDEKNKDVEFYKNLYFRSLETSKGSIDLAREIASQISHAGEKTGA